MIMTGRTRTTLIGSQYVECFIRIPSTPPWCFTAEEVVCPQIVNSHLMIKSAEVNAVSKCTQVTYFEYKDIVCR